jgi:hypothetical protein
MINTKRMLLAWVVVVVATSIYDWLVFSILLQPILDAHPGIFRPQADLPMLRMFLSGALAWALVTLLYALFARGRASRLSTGIVFGVLMGLICGWIPQVFNKMLLVNWPFYLSLAPAGFFEFLLAGIILGLLYREQ